MTHLILKEYLHVELNASRSQAPAWERIHAVEAPASGATIALMSVQNREQRKLVKALDWKWDPVVKLWYSRYVKVKGVELEKLDNYLTPVERGPTSA